jgi:class 3 adenylate cyclase/tetratricopeptide (TPR) repeat protein
MFVDLVGFTSLSEGHDPEEVRELLSRYFDVARTVVDRYGGTVEKFIGDAVMAVWGAPVAREGDVERAVRAALDVVGAVAALGTELGTPALAARAGVVTGEVAVSLAAAGEGMVAGDAVSTAARVQTAAGAGGVLVDEATRRLAALAITFEDAGEHVLKGKLEPARLWRALRVVSGLAGSQRPDGLEAPLCGRDEELRALRELFHACADRHQARLVTVSGPAGVGKSRLGWELEKYIDGLADTVLWHRGRCLSYGDGVAFWALAEMVRQRFGIAEEDPSEVAAWKLAEGLARFVADPVERAYVGARLGRLLGVPAEGDTGVALAREELFAGWRVFFERLAEVAPVVLMVEDAQHADPSLLDFLDHLVDWARGTPVFVVVLGRPELGSVRSSFGSGRNRTTLSLGPLDGASMGRLLGGLLPGLAAEAIAAIASQAQGVPLFAVETVRSLLDRGVLASTEVGGYRLVGELGALAVPDSLHALLAARLDILGPGVRSLVANASVLGTSFPAEALVAISGQPEPEVRAGLAELVRREVLEVSADPLSPQRGDYRFAQGMLRKVAYETLSRRDRKARHLAVAAHLRSTFADDGEEVMDVVARHYLDALEAVPDDPDVSDLHRLAVEALVRAAERAERAGAAGGAAASYESAAELDERQGGTTTAAGLWERASSAWTSEANCDAAVKAAERARALYEELGDERTAARARTLAGRALRIAGRHREAREQLEPALVVLRTNPGTDTVHAVSELAALETFGGGADAARLIAEALNLAQGLDVDDTVLSQLLAICGIHCDSTNRPVEAAANLKEAAYLGERAGDTTQIGVALLNLSALELTRSPEQAAVHASAAAGHLRRLGNRRFLAVAIANQVVSSLLVGDWDRAAEEVEKQAELDGVADIGYLSGLRGWLAALRGDTARAADAIASLAGLVASENLQEQAVLATTRALAATAAGHPAEALAHARAALSYAETLGLSSEHVVLAWPVASDAANALGDRETLKELLSLLDAHPVGHLPPLLRAERALARAHLAAGAGEPGAEGALAEAVSAFRRAGSPWHLGQALVDHAGHLAALGRPSDAEAALDEAQAIAERLGARPLARRAAALRADQAQAAS